MSSRKKGIKTVVNELREQVEELMDPKDPTRLSRYTADLRGGIDSLVSLLEEDPTMVALAFHGQIKFKGKREIATMSERSRFVKDDWDFVKKAILMHTEAHKAVKILEEANLQEVLVIAVIANFKLKQRKASETVLKEEDEIYGSE